jgi:hypothetical protein
MFCHAAVAAAVAAAAAAAVAAAVAAAAASASSIAVFVDLSSSAIRRKRWMPLWMRRCGRGLLEISNATTVWMFCGIGVQRRR